MIDIKKRYRTRGGDEVVLWSDEGTGEFPILGAVKNAETGKLEPETWTTKGSYHHGEHPGVSNRDLVEVPAQPEPLTIVSASDNTLTIAASGDEEAQGAHLLIGGSRGAVLGNIVLDRAETRRLLEQLQALCAWMGGV